MDTLVFGFPRARAQWLGPVDSKRRWACLGSGVAAREGGRQALRNGSCSMDEKRPGNGAEIFCVDGGYLDKRLRGQNVKPVGCRIKGLQSEPPDNATDTSMPERWDVVGLGQAMVDFSGMVGDEFLDKLGLQKGVRKVINHEERGKVLQALDGRSFKASAGGSLSNTFVALARLGMAQSGRSTINIAMAGSVGSDPLGDFYRAKLLRANVHFLSLPTFDGTTGTVIVLTTPDAQRTMLSYKGASPFVKFDSAVLKTISTSKILVVEGYLWEIPQSIEVIAEASEVAHRNGVLVALTASDVSCVIQHRKQFWDVMALSADILFTNSDEASAVCALGRRVSPAFAAHHLSQFCPFVSVTDGAHGSYIGMKGEVLYISPASCIPVDTCGAGDAYAAGILYGFLKGMSNPKRMGNLAARVAAIVVGQQGTRLRQRDAVELVGSLYSCTSIDERIFEARGIFMD